MRVSVLVLAVGLIPSAAAAKAPFYVGIWSPSAKSCKANPLEVEGAIFRIERSQIIWNETTCAFKLSAARPTGNGTAIPATCESEGRISKTTYMFDTVSGRMRMNGHVMVRCKDSDWRTGYE
ncbi:hypothetical protein [Methylobacterium frigidaeris]|uniref:DUF3617 domain-containing protein n=1 Tax=Methylobacterium frigidaeris TaxID=2038277 RepID=A0AA37HEY4_9HYPH|nr:hypothetical protein [Methylobacterium frigidaeris]GJD64281.1 hypothetical protein MPEAHAMD_4462 [Methylobacterium frigidaeris]